jgi:hypothetical protein
LREEGGRGKEEVREEGKGSLERKKGEKKEREGRGPRSYLENFVRLNPGIREFQQLLCQIRRVISIFGNNKASDDH